MATMPTRPDLTAAVRAKIDARNAARASGDTGPGARPGGPRESRPQHAPRPARTPGNVWADIQARIEEHLARLPAAQQAEIRARIAPHLAQLQQHLTGMTGGASIQPVPPTGGPGAFLGPLMQGLGGLPGIGGGWPPSGPGAAPGPGGQSGDQVSGILHRFMGSQGVSPVGGALTGFASGWQGPTGATRPVQSPTTVKPTGLG
jgi:hypothetical protein